MRSVPSRSSDASHPARIVASASPRIPWAFPTFVAITSSSRFPRAAIHRPMIRSDCPRGLPSTQSPYPSAVSMKLPPAAT